MATVDYTKFSKDGKVQDDSNLDKRWWLVNKTDRAKAIYAVVNQISKYDSQRQMQYELSAKMYGNTQLLGLTGLGPKKGPTQPAQTVKERLTYNVVQSAIDTVVAKLAKNKPRPLFLTSGGDWKLQRRAKKLDKFVEGIFYENDLYNLRRLYLRDGAVMGDGLVQVYELHDRVKCDRALASELYVDWFEAYYGNPRQLHRVKNVDRSVLIDMFPEKKNVIKSANTADMGLQSSTQNVSDQVTVIESWHLPSGPEATDGMHAIGLTDEPLFEEKWEKSYFPFARFSWSPKMNGHWAQSAAEQVQSIQYEINKILWVVQRSLDKAGTFKILSKIGNKIPKEHLTNDIGLVLEYMDEPPQYLTPPIVPVELYNQITTLKQAAFEQLGVSMLSASAQKPAGLDSGRALREYLDNESDRFTTVAQSDEQCVVTLGKLIVDCGRDIAKKNKNKYKVQVPGKKFIESIDWNDINLENDEFFLKVFPVSSLPRDPAGRLQTIQEYVQAGFITSRTARRLLDLPDLESVEDLETAREDYLHMILEKMVDADFDAADFDLEKVYTPPELAFDDVMLAKELALEYYQQGKLNNMDERNLDLIRRFIDQLNAPLTNQPAPPMPGQPGAMPQGMPGASPQAQPEPTPTSNMIPNVAGPSA